MESSSDIHADIFICFECLLLPTHLINQYLRITCHVPRNVLGTGDSGKCTLSGGDKRHYRY